MLAADYSKQLLNVISHFPEADDHGYSSGF
jgi:hypothetical protein